MTPEDTYIRPPRFSEWLLKRMFPEKGVYTLVGDVAETFQQLYLEKGRRPARLFSTYILKKGAALPAYGTGCSSARPFPPM